MVNSDISIILTSHKGVEPYIKETYQSILAQTVKPLEIIHVVDGYEKPLTFPNTTTILRDKNLGVATSRDQGVRLSKGKYILFVDGDDVLPETFLEEMLKAIKKGDVAYPDVLLWSFWGDESPLDNVYYEVPHKINLKQLLKQNKVVVTSLMKKEVYTSIGGFNTELKAFEDWEFFVIALHKGYKFCKANTYLKYRQRTQSRNHQSDEVKKQATEEIKSNLRKLGILDA